MHFIERTLWTNTGIITINKLGKIPSLQKASISVGYFFKVQFNQQNAEILIPLAVSGELGELKS